MIITYDAIAFIPPGKNKTTGLASPFRMTSTLLSSTPSWLCRQSINWSRNHNLRTIWRPTPPKLGKISYNVPSITILKPTSLRAWLQILSLNQLSRIIIMGTPYRRCSERWIPHMSIIRSLTSWSITINLNCRLNRLTNKDSTMTDLTPRVGALESSRTTRPLSLPILPLMSSNML